jgi:DMSO/TMAO reductase YedYZ molybdopterin-dependent catalytic subunit
MIRFLECPANGGMEWRGAQMDALQFTHGMLSCCEWTGVLLSTLLQEVGINKDAAWILAEGADGAHMSRSIPLEKAMDDALIVYAQNGEPLRPEQGYPIRQIHGPACRWPGAEIFLHSGMQLGSDVPLSGKTGAGERPLRSTGPGLVRQRKNQTC